MQLSSRQLNGFIEVSRTQNFHKAAKRLFITQSALSQRIKQLEEDIGTVLFVRNRANVFLTESGKKLLAYCKILGNLEADYLKDIRNDKTLDLEIRLTTFSSILRSVLLPILKDLVKEHPGILLDCQWDEMSLLKSYLKEGRSDYVISDHEFNLHGVNCEFLGYEENVMIASPLESEKRSDIFFDHDPDDDMTQRFFEFNNIKDSYRRSYMSDVYGLIDCVQLGLGRAVVSKHLLDLSRVRIIDHYKTLNTPVYLHYNKKPFYSRNQEMVLSLIKEGCRARLKN